MRTASAAVAAMLVIAVVVARSMVAEAAIPNPPVYAHDFPDPEIVRDGLDWYMYGTNVFPFGFTVNVPVVHSTDADNWTYVKDAFPQLGSWARSGLTWAPGVIRIGNTWHLYYTARDTASDDQCIGHATSSSPTGPFTDNNAQPFMCQTDHGGSIDASPFVGADGQRYLLWKSDDNAIPGATATVLWAAPINSSGNLTSSPTPLLFADSPWQRGIVEGPAMVSAGGQQTWLFYGGGDWQTSTYGIGVASCSTPLGPCSNRTPDGPWLGRGNGLTGPGGPSVAIGPLGRPVLAYHGWLNSVGYPAGARATYIDPFDVTALGPYLRPDLPRIQRDPVGSLDMAASAGPGSMSVAGWAIDPDTASPIDVHVYVDGRGFVLSKVSSPRPDISAFFPDYRANHGFTAQLNGIAPGAHTVCAYGINVQQGVNSGIGCRSVTVPSGSPVGSLDVVQAGEQSLTVAGWAIDPDTAASINVDVYVDGQGFALGSAQLSRPDLRTAFPGYGDNHGFGAALSSIPPGPHTVCAYGINKGAGQNSGLGCASVFVSSGSPFGSLDVAQGGSGSISVSGWTIDPDTASPIDVHVYVDGQGFVLGNAAQSRPDVAAAFPGYDDDHGFSAQLSGITPGRHTVCAYGINVGPGSNSGVGCTTATVG